MARRRIAGGFSWLWVASVVACSGGGPPLESMDLRDALSAEPQVVLALSVAARKDLAERIGAEQTAQHDATSPHAAVDAAPVSAEVRALDADRASRGEDAWITGIVEHRGAELSLRSTAVAPEPRDVSLPPLEGSPAAETLPEETRALRGEAGIAIAALLRESGAHRLVRVTGWPIGAVAIDDAVYVNASWLVALASTEASDAGPLAAPLIVPMGLRGNPYLTYASVEACASDVAQRCSNCIATGGCDDDATLSDFNSGRAECEFLTADSARPAELCALALLSIDSVASCVKSGSGCGIGNLDNVSGNLGSAATFLATAACVNALDRCLSGTTSQPAPTTDGGTAIDLGINIPSGQGCKDPFAACSSSCKGFNDACKSGSCSGSSSGSSCSSCSSCTSCKGSSSDGTSSSNSCSGCKSSSGSGGGSNSCKCETIGESPPPLAPTLAWLLAPLGVLFTRGRRRS